MKTSKLQQKHDVELQQQLDGLQLAATLQRFTFGAALARLAVSAPRDRRGQLPPAYYYALNFLHRWQLDGQEGGEL